MPQKSPPAPREQLDAFLADLERALEEVEFFRPPEKHETMSINLRNIFHRMAPSQQDIRTLHGVVLAIAEGRKGPAKGGVLDGEEAQLLRTLLAEHDRGRAHTERGPVRGLARLLRRNPTDAERALWEALTKDRRFATHGFKRQTPVGRHIVDFVSFALRLVIDVVAQDETEAAAGTRSARRVWLAERGYLVVPIAASDIGTDIDRVLAALADKLAQRQATFNG
jgi:tRNA/rRNA methyltransferase